FEREEELFFHDAPGVGGDSRKLPASILPGRRGDSALHLPSLKDRGAGPASGDSLRNQGPEGAAPSSPEGGEARPGEAGRGQRQGEAEAGSFDPGGEGGAFKPRSRALQPVTVAPAHRVLRYLQHPRNARGGLLRVLSRRAAGQVGLPAFQYHDD